MAVESVMKSDRLWRDFSEERGVFAKVYRYGTEYGDGLSVEDNGCSRRNIWVKYISSKAMCLLLQYTGGKESRSILVIENLFFPIGSQRLFDVVTHELANFL